jgi:hypothetical protein
MAASVKTIGLADFDERLTEVEVVMMLLGRQNVAVSVATATAEFHPYR